MKFIKNILEVEIDGLKGVTYYKIYAMYEKMFEDEQGTYAKIELVLLDEFDYTWEEISREGGIGAVNKEIRTLYNIAE